MNQIKIDLERALSPIDRNIFGGFAEHLGRCIYGGIYEPESPHADENGLRRDVLDSLRRLNMPLIRYPGGNFVSGYRWKDGIGPRESRPVRAELAWQGIESNQFGTDEFVDFCRALGTEPYLAVNCGDGDMREARDWVEYCNGTNPTALVKLRQQNGHDAPHNVKYWGIGNEVDGFWQIGFKTATEYARAFTEFGKLMKWVDPSIKLIASVVSHWEKNWLERGYELLRHAPDLVDYMALHWYVGNRDNDFSAYMAQSETFEARLTAYEGLIAAARLEQGIKRPIHIAVDEWNVWYRTFENPAVSQLEEIYNLEDALMVAIQMNAFIRHAASVKMANIAQIVNVIAPVFTRTDGLFLQTIFHPFEIYSRTCGDTALDVFWSGETFSGGSHSGLRVLDVTATLDSAAKTVSVYVVNRHATDAMETTISLDAGTFGAGRAYVVNGADIKAQNHFDTPDAVTTREFAVAADSARLTFTFEPHSVTALTFPVA